jgi:hypothetical protein
MKNKTTVLVVGGMNSGKIAALTAMQNAGLVHVVEYPNKDKQNGLELTEIELDANREAMLQNAGKMEVGKYNRDLQFSYIKSSRPNPSNQKWYNQHLKRRKR